MKPSFLESLDKAKIKSEQKQKNNQEFRGTLDQLLEAIIEYFELSEVEYSISMETEATDLQQNFYSSLTAAATANLLGGMPKREPTGWYEVSLTSKVKTCSSLTLFTYKKSTDVYPILIKASGSSWSCMDIEGVTGVFNEIMADSDVYDIIKSYKRRLLAKQN